MPAQATVGTFFVGKIKIDGESTGFVEKYPMLPGISSATAVANMVTLATARARLLARRHQILKVTVSEETVRRDWYPVTGYTFAPVLIGSEMTDPEETNTTGVGLLFAFDSGDGKRVNRLVKGIRDTWVTRNRNTLAAPTAYGIGGPYLTYTPPATAVDLLGDYLAKVRDLTALYKKTGTGPDSWTPYTFTEYAYRRVSKHDEGRRVVVTRGRQSTMA